MSFNRLATFRSCQNKNLNVKRVPLVSHEGDLSLSLRAHVRCIWVHGRRHFRELARLPHPRWAHSWTLSWAREINSTSGSLFTEYRAVQLKDDLDGLKTAQRQKYEMGCYVIITDHWGSYLNWIWPNDLVIVAGTVWWPSLPPPKRL